MERISANALEKHLRVLTEDIGIRLAGSPNERRAADYLAQVFRQNGAVPSIEEFPVWERVVQEEKLEIFIDGAWKEYPGSLFSSTPGTGGRTLEAPLCLFEAETEYQRSDLSHLRGKAVLHLGCHIESREAYRRLMEAEPAFLLFVDVRYPGAVPLADGMFPAYTKELGAKPTVNVAYLDAWDWVARGASAARLRVVGERRESRSQNVIGELPGTDPAAGVIYMGGHHDTQAGSVGADDNACGSVALLELARVLAPLPRKRTIRLISFGAEEQLSVGSAEYVRNHRADVVDNGIFMFNFDSFGSIMGWGELNVNGPAELTERIVSHFREENIYLRVTNEVVPYTDQFAFAAAGVPGVWFFRRNCVGGRFFHHRADDDISRLSMPLMAEHIAASAACVLEFANADPLPFARTIPEDQVAGIATFWEDLYGGWRGLW